jgi:hypothetical protein
MTREESEGAARWPPLHPCKETGRDASTNLPLPSQSCPANLARTSPRTDQAEKRRGGTRGEPPLPLGQRRPTGKGVQPPLVSLCARFGSSTRRGAAMPPLKHREGGMLRPSVPPGATSTEQPLTWTVARLAVCVNRHFLGAEGVDIAQSHFSPEFWGVPAGRAALLSALCDGKAEVDPIGPNPPQPH